MVSVAQIILASSSLPFLIYGGFIIHQGERVDGAYTIMGGIYTFFAIMLIPYGFPGSYVFPVSLSIAAIGGFHSFASSKRKMKLIKSIVLMAVAILIVLSQEVL